MGQKIHIKNKSRSLGCPPPKEYFTIRHTIRQKENKLINIYNMWYKHGAKDIKIGNSIAIITSRKHLIVTRDA